MVAPSCCGSFFAMVYNSGRYHAMRRRRCENRHVRQTEQKIRGAFVTQRPLRNQEPSHGATERRDDHVRPNPSVHDQREGRHVRPAAPSRHTARTCDAARGRTPRAGFAWPSDCTPGQATQAQLLQADHQRMVQPPARRVSEGTLSGQEEEYAAHRTTRDYVCNTLGIAAWGMVFPFLTIVVTQLVGVEQAGMFSLAFVTRIAAHDRGELRRAHVPGVRLEEEHSFSDYQINRWITCALMVAVGVAYCLVRGYTDQMLTISLGVYVYKMIDGLADVYEGRFAAGGQTLSGRRSQAFRSVVVFVVFSLFLLVTRNLPGACIAMAVAAAVTFLFLTFPLAPVRDAEVPTGNACGASRRCSSSASPCSWRCSCIRSSTTCRSS